MTERPKGQHIYLDANVFIYALEGGPVKGMARQAFAMIASLEATAVTSELSLAEVLVKPLRQNNQTLVSAYETFLHADLIGLVPITKSILRGAAKLRAQSGLKLPDSIHPASAKSAQCSIVLSEDRKMQASGFNLILLSELAQTRAP